MNETPSGLLVPDSCVEAVDRSAQEALRRYYEGMAKLEKTFPQLVKLAAAMAGQIDQAASEKGVAPEGVILEVAKWHPDGTVVVAVSFDTKAKRVDTNDAAMGNFNTLADINERYPQAVELAMSLAFQLVSVVNAKKLLPGEIEVTKPLWNSIRGWITFKMLAGGEVIHAPTRILI